MTIRPVLAALFLRLLLCLAIKITDVPGCDIITSFIVSLVAITKAVRRAYVFRILALSERSRVDVKIRTYSIFEFDSCLGTDSSDVTRDIDSDHYQYYTFISLLIMTIVPVIISSDN